LCRIKNKRAEKSQRPHRKRYALAVLHRRRRRLPEARFRKHEVAVLRRDRSIVLNKMNRFIVNEEHFMAFIH
jgi:hypothetical protein